MKPIYILFTIIFMSGCGGSNNIKLTPNLKLTSQSIHIETPPSSYETAWETWYLNSIKNNIQLFRHIPNMMSEDVSISVEAMPQNEIATDYLLYNNQSNQMEERIRNFKMTDWEKKNNAERGVRYVKQYVDFIGALKCGTRVESSTIALGVGTKSYQTNCTYFDNQGGAKNIHLAYRYTYSHSSTKHEDDTQSSSVTPEAMQYQFKQDIKAIFDSLVIHDMDRERMAKEGLLHDKKYEIQEW